jgi:uncharacterized protein (TIGR02001 family)
MRITLWIVLLPAAWAQAGWEANLTGVSDYVSRGVSQSRNRPALQVDASAWLAGGLYASGWASQVDYPGARTRWELSGGAGWTGEAGPWSLDLGVQQLAYPAEPDFGYLEMALVLGSGPLTLEGVWSPDMAASGAPGGYLSISSGREAGPLLLRTGLGWSWFARDAADQVFGPGSHSGFTTWNVGLSGSLGGLELALDWHGTDGHGRTLNPGLAGNRMVVSIATGLGSD